jgi:hypothetical protein
MVTDLLPVAEELAELDLVVRQLDDGTLTVTTDDRLPDRARTRVIADGPGIKAFQVVAALRPGQASHAAAWVGGMAVTGGRGALVVRGDEVRFEAGIDHGPPFAGPELEALYKCILSGVQETQGRVNELVGPAPEALPSSYLRGAGQRESATDRYGPRDAVPGRSELSPHEAHAHAHAPPRPAGGGGGGAALIIVGLVGLIILAGGAAVVLMPRAAPDAGVPVAATEPEDDIGPLTPRIDPTATAVEPPTTTTKRPGTTTSTRPTTTSTPTATATEPARPPLTEAQALEDAKDATLRFDAVSQWLEQRLDRAPGARRRMFEVIGADLEADPKVGRIVLQSLRDRPPSVAEAVELLDVSRGGVRRLVIEQLGNATGDEATEAVKALEAAVAAPGVEAPIALLLDETLLKLGTPREGALLRLAGARGADWALYGDGRPLLEALSKRDVRALAPLLEQSPDAEVRASVCALVAAADGQQREALALLSTALRDADGTVRQRAIEGLRTIADPRASWPLARLLVRDESNQTRDVARDALQRLPLRETIELLVQLLGQQSVEDRRAAILALAAIGKPEAIPAVVTALRDADRSVKLEALRTLDAAHRQAALRGKVSEALGPIREIALQRGDRELSNIARQLHYAITGRMP